MVSFCTWSLRKLQKKSILQLGKPQIMVNRGSKNRVQQRWKSENTASSMRSIVMRPMNADISEITIEKNIRKKRSLQFVKKRLKELRDYFQTLLCLFHVKIKFEIVSCYTCMRFKDRSRGMLWVETHHTFRSEPLDLF